MAGSPPASTYSPGAGSTPAGGNALPSISSSMTSPVTGNQPIGSQTYGGVNLTNPALPNPSATPTAAQNAANQANALRLNQGLGVLAGGFNAAQGSIGQAMGVAGQGGAYQNAALGAAGTQEQNFAGSLANQGQNAGLDTNMGGLAQRVQGWADQNINEQAASRQAGLLQNQGQLAAQGGSALGNYLGSANIQGPNIQQAAASELQAAQLQALQQASQRASQASRQNALLQAGNYLNAVPPPTPAGPPTYSTASGGGYTIQPGQDSGSTGIYSPPTDSSIASAMLPPTSNPINLSPGSNTAGGLDTSGQAPGSSFAASSTQLPAGVIINPNTGQPEWA